jgi:hypothetical protein
MALSDRDYYRRKYNEVETNTKPVVESTPILDSILANMEQQKQHTPIPAPAPKAKTKSSILGWLGIGK